MSKLAVNDIRDATIVVAGWILEPTLRNSLIHRESSGLRVRIQRKNLREGIAHFYLAVEGLIECFAHCWLQRPVLFSMARSRREPIVFGVVWQQLRAHMESEFGLR